MLYTHTHTHTHTALQYPVIIRDSLHIIAVVPKLHLENFWDVGNEVTVGFHSCVLPPVEVEIQVVDNRYYFSPLNELLVPIHNPLCN